MEIKKVQLYEVSCIIATGKPLGLFYAEDGARFTAVANEHGDAFTESFFTEEGAIAYLAHGVHIIPEPVKVECKSAIPSYEDWAERGVFYKDHSSFYAIVDTTYSPVRRFLSTEPPAGIVCQGYDLRRIPAEQTLQLIAILTSLYYDTDQDVETFSSEYYYLVESIHRGVLPLKLNHLTEWEEHVAEALGEDLLKWVIYAPPSPTEAPAKPEVKVVQIHLDVRMSASTSPEEVHQRIKAHIETMGLEDMSGYQDYHDVTDTYQDYV